ncbi:ADP-ribosyl-[dinitrogen reductase] hydrolase [Candidatus Accumulibacter sp. ACC003]|uniref:ADP-ribosyl-[dinitrogen reductase] hydrolase n=1 Tax=Candidatus Accumulibacter sp. ACC003 TaxID=2823334 RepID=UPI0025B847D7|nr:ADP-ribosyl-[dinitrogen reductase] hydrolase [Candidatus Accumulibacter sp. ACC003]
MLRTGALSTAAETAGRRADLPAESHSKSRTNARTAPLLDKATAAYLGLAIGDALGATVEFLTPNEIRQQHGVHRELSGGGWLHLQAGRVTDDTTMSLALGEAILASGGVDAQAVAAALDAWMRSKPVDIGHTVRRNLIHFRDTGNPEAVACEHDAGNGAAMRTLPVALASYGQAAATTILGSRAQAHVTHHNALSDAACETLIFMVQDFLAGHDAGWVREQHVATLLREQPLFAFARKRRDNPSGYIVETMQAVLQAFFATSSFEECLLEVVNRGGDADTTGAIAGMLAGARYGLQAIPERWLGALDPAIRQHCTRQAAALLALSQAGAP